MIIFIIDLLDLHLFKDCIWLVLDLSYVFKVILSHSDYNCTSMSYGTIWMNWICIIQLYQHKWLDLNLNSYMTLTWCDYKCIDIWALIWMETFHSMKGAPDAVWMNGPVYWMGK